MRQRRGVDPRTVLAIAHDVMAITVAWALGFWFRFNLEIPPGYAQVMLHTLPIIIPVQALIFWWFGLYRGLWRYASLHDLRQILLAVTLAALAIPAVLVLLRMADPIPRSVFVLDPLLLSFLMGGSRIAYRAWKEGHIGPLGNGNARPVLILGGGDAAESLIRELAAKPDWRVVGLLDDNDTNQGRQIHGVRVRGRIDQVQRVAQERNVKHVIVAMPSGSHSERRQAVHLAAQAGLRVMTVPSFDDIVSGKVTVSQLRAGRARRSARARSRRAGQRRAVRIPVRQDGDGDRGRRLDRLRAVPPDRALPAIQADSVRAVRVRALPSGAGVSRAASDAADRVRGRRLPQCAARGEHSARVPAAGGVPRGRVQARAADGGSECLGGRAEQRARHARGRGCRRAPRSRRVRADLHRQGGESGQRHGRHQAPGRDGVPVAADRSAARAS